MSRNNVAVVPTSNSHSPTLMSRELTTCPVCGGNLQRQYNNLVDHFELVPDRFSIDTCDSCGLGITNPHPVDNLHLLYPEGYLSSTSAQSEPRGLVARAEAWYRRDQSHFDFNLLTCATGIELRNIRSYVDIGCGTGERVAFAYTKGCAEVMGIDSYDFFNAGLDKSRHFKLTEICDFKPTKKFQLVSLFHVMEHLPDPVGVVQHIVEHILEPGGFLLIQVPNFGGIERRIFGRRWSALDIPRHFWHFDSRSLSHLLNSPQLQMLRSFEKNAALHPVTFAASLHRNMHIQRIWVKSRENPGMYWMLMRVAWMLMTVLSIPLNMLQNIMSSASMLSVIAQRSSNEKSPTSMNHGT